MQTPKPATELRLSPRTGREGLATTVASFRFTENTAHPLSGAEATTNLKTGKPTLVFTQKATSLFGGKCGQPDAAAFIPFFYFFLCFFLNFKYIIVIIWGDAS